MTVIIDHPVINNILYAVLKAVGNLHHMQKCTNHINCMKRAKSNECIKCINQIEGHCFSGWDGNGSDTAVHSPFPSWWKISHSLWMGLNILATLIKINTKIHQWMKKCEWTKRFYVRTHYFHIKTHTYKCSNFESIFCLIAYAVCFCWMQLSAK